MKCFRFICCLLLLLISSTSIAANSFIVKNIRIEGLQGISRATVMTYMPIKVGDKLTIAKSQEVIEKLYATGFFQDIQLFRQGDALLVKVQQRATLAGTKVSGNKHIDRDKINWILADFGLVRSKVYSQAAFDQFKQAILTIYVSQGRYSVKIEPNLINRGPQNIFLDIDIREGPVAEIKSIEFVGNHAFSSAKLLSQLILTTYRPWVFFTESDHYTKAKLRASIGGLANFYLDHGYINFRVDSSEVTLMPDRKKVYIILKVSEGGRYRVKSYQLTGHLILPKQELNKLVSIQPGKYFSRKVVQKTVSDLATAYGNRGYVFANIKVIPQIDDKTHQVSLEFKIDPGKRVYVRRINFLGHLKTSDIVLRREFHQLEASLYSTDKLQESIRRLKLLGYLKDVGLKINQVVNTEDQVDVDIHITEAPSAQAIAAVGYGTNGFIFNARLDQPNFLGSGSSLNISFDSTAFSRTYSVSYFNPYFTMDGIGQGFNVYFQRVTPGKLNVTNFASNNYGASLYYTIPVRKDDTITAELGYNDTLIFLGSTPSAQLTSFIATNGRHYSEVSSSLSWTHNGLDQTIFPTKGTKHDLKFKLWLPLDGNLKYYKIDYYGRAYLPMTKDFILKFGANFGFGNGFGSTSGLPFFRNYYAGGIGSIRGYAPNSLGPKDSTGQPLGGNLLFTGSAGLIFPSHISDNLRTSAFIDAGNVYNTGGVFPKPSQSFSPLRYSAGVEVDWRSPLGPLAFSIAKALDPQGGDDLNFFQFSVGTTF